MIDYACLARIYCASRIPLIALFCTVLVAACPAGQFGPLPNPGSVRQTSAKTSVPGRITNRNRPLSPLPEASGPRFTQITTSRESFVKSDCLGTSITVTASITAPAGIAQVLLWYRVGDQQPFTSVAVAPVGDDHYVVTVQGTDVSGSDYGVWAFYFTADDKLGQHRGAFQFQGERGLRADITGIPGIGQGEQGYTQVVVADSRNASTLKLKCTH